MDLDMNELDQSQRYKVLTALVIPRPIAWVSSENPDGSCNVAPYSFFNVLGNRPPVIGFGPGSRPEGGAKDTQVNLERSGEFVVNLVDRDVAAAMHQSAVAYPAGVSESEVLGLETAPGHYVAAPRIICSKVQLECKHHSTLEVLDNRIVLGLIVGIHVDDGILDPETLRINAGTFQAVGRLHGPGWYSEVNDPFDLGRLPKP